MSNLSLIFKVLFLIISGYGLSESCTSGSWWTFNYYTVLSNAACFAYIAAALVWHVRQRGLGIGGGAWRPRLNAATVFAIMVTFLIYAFLLGPDDLRAGIFWTPHNIVVHYVVPIMFVADWMFFCPRGRLKRWDPVMWPLIPLIYFAYILVRAPIFGDIGPDVGPYPYHFIDIATLGIPTVVQNTVLIMIGMIVLGYVIYFVDRGIARMSR